MPQLRPRRKLQILALSLLLAACSKRADTGTSRSVVQGLASNPGALVVSEYAAYSQVMAISDVHGMYDPLLKLLRAGGVIDDSQHWTGGRTLLIVVGDSIDKGPQSLEVLDLWIALMPQAAAAGGRVLHLLGNHEAEFLSDPANDKKAVELSAELKQKHASASDLTDASRPRGALILAEPVAARVGNWLFAHAGLFPAEMSWDQFSAKARQVLTQGTYGDAFLIGDDSILEAKDWEKKRRSLQAAIRQLDTIGVYGVVFGHQPDAFGIEGRSAAAAGGRLIKIDNGMAPEAGSHAGSLLVFPHPAQLGATQFPEARVIQPDGSAMPLLPEGFTPAE